MEFAVRVHPSTVDVSYPLLCLPQGEIGQSLVRKNTLPAKVDWRDVNFVTHSYWLPF